MLYLSNNQLLELIEVMVVWVQKIMNPFICVGSRYLDFISRKWVTEFNEKEKHFHSDLSTYSCIICCVIDECRCCRRYLLLCSYFYRQRQRLPPPLKRLTSRFTLLSSCVIRTALSVLFCALLWAAVFSPYYFPYNIADILQRLCAKIALKCLY